MVVVDMREDKRGRKECWTRIRNRAAVYQPDEMSGETRTLDLLGVLSF